MSQLEAAMISDDAIQEAVSWRRHLHQRPELAFAEYETAEFIAARLREAGLTVHVGIAGTGVVGTLQRGSSTRAIGIRADMDALPIEERAQIGYRSQRQGVMHACGHDGHVAIALAAARACTRLQNLDGVIHFIFQPAEENEGGAKRMLEEGLFRLYPCDEVYALHNWPDLPLGTCAVRDGAMMGALATFDIQLTGRGCHAAMPNEGSDPILAAAHLVAALQSVVSRSISPSDAAVLSVTQIHAGDALNAIPGSCSIRGTSRWLEEPAGDIIERRLGEVSRYVADALGCEAQARYVRRYPATVNDPAVARKLRAIACSRDVGLEVLDRKPSMAAEDFAYMLREIPGCYVWLGVGGKEGGPPLHSPNYDFNDALLPLGVSLWLSVIRRNLAPS